MGDVYLDKCVRYRWLHVLELAVKLWLYLYLIFLQIWVAFHELRLKLHHFRYICAHLWRNLIVEERNIIQNYGLDTDLNLVKIRHLLSFRSIDFIINIRVNIAVHRLVVLAYLYL